MSFRWRRARHLARCPLSAWGICDGIRGNGGRRKRLAAAAAAVFGAQIAATPASAQAGFLDELFGQLFRPPVYKSYPPRPPWAAPPGYRHRQHRFGSGALLYGWARGRFIPVERPDDAEEDEQRAERQQPTNIMEDESLRRGDAVMTEAGIRIFVGHSGDSHGPGDFRRPSEVRGLSKVERKALAALDPQGPATEISAGTVTGRSAADPKIAIGEMITDAKGRAIRYVGP